MKAKSIPTCLRVASLGKCTRFYRQYLGLEIIDRHLGPGGGSVFMAPGGHAGNPVLKLTGGGPVANSIDNIRQGKSHLAFEVGSTDGMARLAKRARAEGILLWGPDAHLTGAWSIGVLDPNGHCVEFSHHHPQAGNRGTSFITGGTAPGSEQPSASLSPEFTPTGMDRRQ